MGDMADFIIDRNMEMLADNEEALLAEELPFTDPIQPTDDTAAYHGQVDAV
jgi:hypothetical protein